MLLSVTRAELAWIVQGLAMIPKASDLHWKYAAALHFESLLPIPEDCRRVWVRSFKDGQETSVEYYDPGTCDRIEAAIDAVQRPRREALGAISASVHGSTSKASRRRVG